MLPNLGVPEILIVLVILVLLFGARRIPELAKGIGNGVREFRENSRHDGAGTEEVREPAQLTAAKPEDSTERDG